MGYLRNGLGQDRTTEQPQSWRRRLERWRYGDRVAPQRAPRRTPGGPGIGPPVGGAPSACPPRPTSSPGAGMEWFCTTRGKWARRPVGAAEARARGERIRRRPPVAPGCGTMPDETRLPQGAHYVCRAGVWQVVQDTWAGEPELPPWQDVPTDRYAPPPSYAGGGAPPPDTMYAPGPEEPVTEGAAPQPPPPKGLAALVRNPVVLLGGAALAAWWFFGRKKGAAAAPATP